jgi:hypothetical protein
MNMQVFQFSQPIAVAIALPFSSGNVNASATSTNIVGDGNWVYNWTHQH